jgi:hypothetical protein
MALRRRLVFWATWVVTLCSRMALTQSRVVPLVGTQRPWMKAAQLGHHVAFGRTAGLGELEVDQQSMAILHQRVTDVREPGLKAAAFPGQPQRTAVGLK